ncbi:MAG: DNA-binding protein [Candidatus Bathyarchaeia archaeon]
MKPFSFGEGRIKRAVLVKVEPGNDLHTCLREAVSKLGIKAGLIVSGVGSLKKARLRNLERFPDEYPIRDEHRAFTTVEGPLEILSLEGNILERSDGELTVHAHITLSKVEDGGPKVLGGHLVEGNETYVMVEIALAELEGVKAVRAIHPETKGWELQLNGS